MQRKTESIFFLSVGPIAAILLGMALVPLRSFTSASNFTFVFIVLTILIAEYGGGRAAVATALSSALSLDFFLTQPYLRLTIADKHDIIAFGGLALCGLLAAGFSSARANRAAELRSAHEQLDLLHSAIVGLESAETVESRLGKLLDAARVSCPLAAAAIRDERNSILAAFQQGKEAMRVPVQVLSPQTLLPRGAGADDLAPENIPFPKEGARVPLVVQKGQVGWLDLWGNGAPASAESRRTLSDVTFLLALLLAAAGIGMGTLLRNGLQGSGAPPGRITR
jgi:K+-sensing histidine kinase KdpD